MVFAADPDQVIKNIAAFAEEEKTQQQISKLARFAVEKGKQDERAAQERFDIGEQYVADLESAIDKASKEVVATRTVGGTNQPDPDKILAGINRVLSATDTALGGK